MAILHAARAHAAMDGPSAEDAALHEELADESEDDDVKGHEEEVARAFPIVRGNVGV